MLIKINDFQTAFPSSPLLQHAMLHKRDLILVEKWLSGMNVNVLMNSSFETPWFCSPMVHESRTDKVRSSSGDNTSEEVESLWNPKYPQSTNRQRLPFSVKVLSSSEARSLMSFKITRKHIFNLSADSSLRSTHIISLTVVSKWTGLVYNATNRRQSLS